MSMHMDTWDKLWAILDEEAHWDDVVYVYRLASDGKTMKPYLLRDSPWPGLPDCLRDEHHGGRFKVLIRKGRRMIFSGEITIEVPLLRR